MESPVAVASTEYYFPNKMARIVLLAMEEVMGRNGVAAVLNLANLKHLVNNYPPNNFDLQVTFGDLGALMRALDVMYGPRGGRGLALRAGRACFKHGLKEFGAASGIDDLSFRLLPLPLRLKVGGEAFCATLNQYSDQLVQCSETDDTLVVEIGRCAVCWGRTGAGPCCFLWVGLLQEALYWASGGKYFDVNETACVACGDEACTLVVSKQPLD